MIYNYTIGTLALCRLCLYTNDFAQFDVHYIRGDEVYLEDYEYNYIVVFTSGVRFYSL